MEVATSFCKRFQLLIAISLLNTKSATGQTDLLPETDGYVYCEEPYTSFRLPGICDQYAICSPEHQAVLFKCELGYEVDITNSLDCIPSVPGNCQEGPDDCPEPPPCPAPPPPLPGTTPSPEWVFPCDEHTTAIKDHFQDPWDCDSFWTCKRKRSGDGYAVQKNTCPDGYTFTEVDAITKGCVMTSEPDLCLWISESKALRCEDIPPLPPPTPAPPPTTDNNRPLNWVYPCQDYLRGETVQTFQDPWDCTMYWTCMDDGQTITVTSDDCPPGFTFAEVSPRMSECVERSRKCYWTTDSKKIKAEEALKQQQGKTLMLSGILDSDSLET